MLHFQLDYDTRGFLIKNYNWSGFSRITWYASAYLVKFSMVTKLVTNVKDIGKDR